MVLWTGRIGFAGRVYPFRSACSSVMKYISEQVIHKSYSYGIIYEKRKPDTSKTACPVFLFISIKVYSVYFLS